MFGGAHREELLQVGKGNSSRGRKSQHVILDETEGGNGGERCIFMVKGKERV
jgi:hypothetical protein